MKTTLLYLSLLYVSVPVLLYLFPWLLGHLIYSHLLRLPMFVDLDKPEAFLNHTCNFYLSPEEGVSLGVWHTLPASQWGEAKGRGCEWYKNTLGDGSPVIIYLHGNVGTRALSHRVQLVKVLSSAGNHVLSVDYRGFGDSSGEPSEVGLTSDALFLYQWVKQHGGHLVCLWGHSLGSGVATNAALIAQERGSSVDAVILEAPFTSIGEAVVSQRITKVYTVLPGFESLLWTILRRTNIKLANDENLRTLTSPLLLLHSEDDDVVPYHMGQKLYQIALEAQRARDREDLVQMVSYSAAHGYSHNRIHLDPDLPSLVGRFLQSLR